MGEGFSAVGGDCSFGTELVARFEAEMILDKLLSMDDESPCLKVAALAPLGNSVSWLREGRGSEEGGEEEGPGEARGRSDYVVVEMVAAPSVTAAGPLKWYETARSGSVQH